MDKLTELQKKMAEAQGHKVEIQMFKNLKTVYKDNICIGICVACVSPQDNDSDAASLYIQIPEYDGLIEISEKKIENIKLLD